MTQETTNDAGLPTSGFVITHYLRPGGNALSWQQWTSGELSAADAVACINERAAEAAGLGFADPAAEPAPDPTGAAGGAPAAESASTDAPADGPAPGGGEYE